MTGIDRRITYNEVPFSWCPPASSPQLSPPLQTRNLKNTKNRNKSENHKKLERQKERKGKTERETKIGEIVKVKYNDKMLHLLCSFAWPCRGPACCPPPGTLFRHDHLNSIAHLTAVILIRFSINHFYLQNRYCRIAKEIKSVSWGWARSGFSGILCRICFFLPDNGYSAGYPT